MKTAKEEILDRIRQALGDLPPRTAEPVRSAPQGYLRSDSTPHEEQVERFIERVTEYKATVRRVASQDLAKAIAAACAQRKVRRLVVPNDLPEAWIPSDVEQLRDPGLTNQQLDTSDGVLTACRLGIAQTGTIVLDAGPGQGRRALTLLPDYHLCVIAVDQIVGLVPEAVAQLNDAVRVPGHPLTWISGPSATSDIELNRVEGVHGPRTLDVLVVG
ncbi:lactate utilization protein C [Singulisphaera sp. Ch08]|uniref:Lactate utilization protein C n=1 Tax=Singulisphaera sp. Ch08 TaxID=3120278 RepID=A0AAU7CRB7_9BACT